MTHDVTEGAQHAHRTRGPLVVLLLLIVPTLIAVATSLALEP